MVQAYRNRNSGQIYKYIYQGSMSTNSMTVNQDNTIMIRSPDQEPIISVIWFRFGYFQLSMQGNLHRTFYARFDDMTTR
jgi:hypothetical protein